MEKYTYVLAYTSKEFFAWFDKGHDYIILKNSAWKEVSDILRKKTDARSLYFSAIYSDDFDYNYQIGRQLITNRSYSGLFLMALYYAHNKQFDKTIEFLLEGHNKGIIQCSLYLSRQYLYNDKYKNVPKALRILEELADDRRYPFAAYTIANYYLKNKIENHDYAKHYIELAIEIGYPKAEILYGNYCEEGYAVKNDYKKAVEIYTKYAELGDSFCAAQLGYLYNHGYGCNKDHYLSYKYSLQAAKDGIDYAQFNVGLDYYFGEGVNQDYQSSLYWFKKAAEQGITKAYSYIGDLYYFGYGVRQDYAEAGKWYEKAGKTDNPDISASLGDLYYHGKGGYKEDKYKAFNYFASAAERGNKYAQYMYANMLENGICTDQNIKTAYKYYRFSAKQGNKDAEQAVDRLENQYDLSVDKVMLSGGSLEFYLGKQYFECEDILNNFQKAVEYFIESANLGYPSAYHYLGYCYRYGKGVPIDFDKAISYFKQSGFAASNLELGELYLFGHGVEKDYKTAYEYLSKASSQKVAKYYLGYMLEHGLYVKKNLDGAFEYYEQSAKENVTAAINRLQKPDYQEYLGRKKTKDMLYEVEKFDHSKRFDQKRLELMSKIYDSGYHLIAYELGKYYLASDNPKHDYGLGLEYMQEAYDLGHKDAPYQLAAIYANGVVTKSNPDLVFRYSKEAESRGDKDAYYLLYLCYKRGYGIDVDEDKAMKYLQLSADSNNPYAKCDLGIICFKNKDYDKAFKLLSDSHLGEAYIYIGQIYEMRKQYLKAINAYESATWDKRYEAYDYLVNLELKLGNQRSAYDYYKKAIEEHNYLPAYLALADKLYEGKVFKKNHTLAESLYQKAAELGSEAAKEALKTKEFKKGFLDKKKL